MKNQYLHKHANAYCEKSPVGSLKLRFYLGAMHYTILFGEVIKCPNNVRNINDVGHSNWCKDDSLNDQWTGLSWSLHKFN